MKDIFLGLGSNVGDREDYLRKAISILGDREDIQLNRISSIYETEPWGKTNQDFFLNQVAEIETELDPWELMAICQEIEKSLGREKNEKWGPRIIDIDLLLFGEQIVDEENLQVPHPRLSERWFVLIPLNEVASLMMIPGSGQTVQEALERCSDQGSVRLYKKVDACHPKKI